MKDLFRRGKILLGTAAIAGLLVSGCGNSENFVFTNTAAVPVVPVPAPPVAVNDARTSLGNATVTYTAVNGVLINDTVNGATISAFDAVGSNGGTVAVNADGSFSYTPVFGFVGAETFTYTLSNVDGDSTATVTMTSTGQGFFVNNQAGATGNGSQADPFDAIADAIAVAGNGDTIFVSRGDGTNTGLAGAILLPAGVDLVGEGTGLILAQTIVPAGQDPLLTGPITCLGDNTVQGFAIDTDGTIGIDIDGAADVTVADITFSTTTSTIQYIDILDATGTITINNNVFGPMSDDEYIDIDADTTVNIIITNNQFNDDNVADPDEALEVDSSGTGVMSLVFSGNIITSPTAASGTSFSDGLEVDAGGTSQFTLTADNNNITNVDDEGFDLESDSGATLSGTVTNNMIVSPDDNGILMETNSGSATLSGNTITDANGDGMQLDAEDNGATYIVTGNTVTGSDDDAIDIDDEDDGDMEIAIRDNTLTGSSNDSIHATLENNQDICMDITGNTVDDDMFFANDLSGTLSVERFDAGTGGPLNTVNTFTGGMVVEDDPNDVTPVAAGFCTIP